jgi:stage V sporulation protein SpoVS
MKNVKNVVVLKASKTSNTKSLGSAVARELIKNYASDVEVQIRAIGVQAVNQAVKAIAIAGGFTGQQGRTIDVRIGFHNVSVVDRLESEQITAMVFLLSLG